MDQNTMIELVSQLGSFGFILWLVHRTTTHTIPRLAKSFEDAIEKQRQDFKEVFAQQRADFERMMQREQDVHAAQTERMVQALSAISNAIQRKPTDV